MLAMALRTSNFWARLMRGTQSMAMVLTDALAFGTMETPLSAQWWRQLGDETKALTISVKPGWKKGTKVTFAQEGDAAPNVVPADIVFSLSELPHPVFSREGHNLVFVATVTLSEALCGTTLEVPTLDGRKLAVSCPEVVSPGYEKTVTGEGMPLSKTPDQRGNLIIRFHIVFPKYLEDNQKQVLKKTLAQ